MKGWTVSRYVMRAHPAPPRHDQPPDVARDAPSAIAFSLGACIEGYYSSAPPWTSTTPACGAPCSAAARAPVPEALIDAGDQRLAASLSEACSRRLDHQT